MEQAHFERVTRQTQVRRLLQKAVLNLCQKNYAECAPNLEVDGIICISFPDSPDQHVVKIHEKIQLSESRIQTSCDKLQNETILSRVQKSTDTGLFENEEQITMVTKNDLNGVVEDKDRMQNSYFDEGHAFSTRFISSGNPVFPKMVPVSSQNNKILDSESHSSKSKRKMFKVVQRKRTTLDEPEILSDSDNEMPGSINTSENPNTNSNLYDCNPCQDKNASDVKLPSNIKKTNVCESVEDGYVIVKVENFDDDVAVHEKSEPTSSYDKNKAEFNCETQRFRQWIQLPSHDDREETSQNRESLITIDGRVPEHSEDYINRNYFSRIEEENPLTDKDTGNYQVRGSVGQIDLSQSKDYQHDSFNYPPKDIQMSSTPRFPSTSRNSHHALFSESLIQKSRPSQSKGSKTLDNLFLNKCSEDLQSKLNRNKTSNTTDILKQNEKAVSMIDLQSTSNDLTDSKLPDALSVSLNRLISTHAAKEKKYFCRHCGKGFTLKCTRSRHEKTICGGGGEGQYRCHICMKVFTRSDSRCRHLWKTHGVKSTSEVSPVC
jgi:hypothetical protein